MPALVEDIGCLIGLLSRTAGGVSFDFDWFGSAAAQLRQVPQRGQPQLDLLGNLPGPGKPDAPPGTWYRLPLGGGEAPFYIVVEPGNAAGTGVVGIGLWDDFAPGPATVRATAFAPLLAIPVGQTPVVAGSPAHPVELNLAVTFATPVAAPGLSFDGISLACRLFLTGAAPAFTLTFTSGGKPAGDVVGTLEGLRSTNVRQWVDALLATDGVAAWLARPVGGSSIKVGDVFAATGLLVSGKPWTLGSLDAFTGKTPVAIGEMLLAAALDLLASNSAPLVSLGSGGISVFKTAAPDGNDYGLRLQLQDIVLTGAGGPAISAQVGKLLEGESDASSWLTRCGLAGVVPGIALTLLNDNGGAPAFRLKLDLVSLGVDLAGSGGAPLFDVGGVTLGGGQLRFHFSWDLAQPTAITWGVAAAADQLGIPLANGLSGANANPVVQNLLASGGSGGGDSEAVNPAFSLSLAGLAGFPGAKPLDVQLYSADGCGDVVWLPMQRAFGPLQCRRIGVAWPQDNPERALGILFDGGVSLAALAIDLEGLSLGIPLASPGQVQSYTLDLQGLGLSFAAGPISLGGGFLKNDNAGVIEYDGAATIQAADWSIAAEGSYASLGGGPSLFVFAQLDAELGGPPFFFVTGLCAGFGYNRSLRIPTQDQVPDFPLLAGISNPAAIGGAGATPAAALAALDDWIAPVQGVDWFAAGVQFTSFELVQSNAVVAAVLSDDPQIALLGVSRLKLGQTGPEFAYAELGLEVVLRPSTGFFGASAVLSPNSYLLTKDCHLTGGFAFWIWFEGEHAGDFVVTLGGYHPAFQKPPHYPDEQRLGFSWQVNDNLTIQGDSYFALTPSCAMGGGELDVVFHAGDLRAWLTAQADFLFYWKPFYFIGEIGVSIGASYKIDLWFTSITVSVELGADLQIWGPPTGGKVHVSWYIISFTVGFGADQQLPDSAFKDWTDFATLLPQKQSGPAPLTTSSMAFRAELPERGMVADAAPAPAAPDVLAISISAGLSGTDPDGAWLVRGDTATFAVATPMPITSVAFDDPGDAQPAVAWPAGSEGTIAIRPMGIAAATSRLVVGLRDSNDGVPLADSWAWSETRSAAPAALWGAPPAQPGAMQSSPTADTVPDQLMGISGLTPPATVTTGPGPVPIASFAYFEIDEGQSDWLPLSAGDPPAARAPVADAGSIQAIAQGVAAPAAVAARDGLFAALVGLGYSPGTNGSMADLAANADLGFPDAPMLGSPWQEAA